ncbi:MFS transporter (plasmid) [Streptomyces sp. NBC_01387]|uniref:MFS transporter n=1 Tax=unclassified Streptomyces TaxID=2593676 RepID=UPI0020245EF3|nr:MULTISPECIES: MFS transporter [unclassified Streptomyces]MCX4554490.1 MFS transporter [Streptomyces sp. NBC_01500]WSC25126.1 MFS transporter [Streptomyces sp. NBC_01766]WSV58993.1 MFS transporter [Streptomyces sp. NBC_01014]
MSTATASAPGETRNKLALGALGLGAFVIGTAELVIVGVLNLIADDLDVSLSTAGLLVTAYALGISIGGPIVTAATIKVSRHTLLCAALAVFVLGNLAAVFAGLFGLLVVARVLCGALHGLFLGAASAVATGLVAPEHRGQAVGLVFGGISVSTVLGVPLGTLLGQNLGWQATFAGVAVLGLAAFVVIMIWVPSVRGRGSGGLASQAQHAFHPRVLAMLGSEVLLMGSQFIAFTYLAAFLEDVTGIKGAMVSVFLMIFGVFSAVGTFAGGRLADINASRTLLVGNGVLIVGLLGLYFFRDSPPLVGVALALWGIVGFGVTPALQLRVISLAGEGADLAATLGASAANVGVASGAAIGGWALTAFGIDDVPLIALVFAVIALPVVWATRFLKVPGVQAPAAGSAPAAASDNTPVSTGG